MHKLRGQITAIPPTFTSSSRLSLREDDRPWIQSPSKFADQGGYHQPDPSVTVDG